MGSGRWETGCTGCAPFHWSIDFWKVIGGIGDCGVLVCLGLDCAGSSTVLCSGSRLTGGGGGTLTGAGLGGGEGRLTEYGGGASIGGTYFLMNFLFLLVTVLELSTLTV